MLAVAKTHRKMAIGTTLVKKAVQAMKDLNADEVLTPESWFEYECFNNKCYRLYWRRNIQIKERWDYIKDLGLLRIKGFIDTTLMV
jgi:hypothetical protein